MKYLEDENATLFAWLDNALLLLGGFILMTAMLLMLASAKPVDPKNDQASADGVTVKVRWPDHSPTDVDLWILCPGDVAVGYSRKQGKVCMLSGTLDNLGADDSLGGLREETAVSKGVPAGEYVVNLGLYRIGNPASVPVKVDVVAFVTIRGAVVPIYSTSVVLNRTSEEQTAVRFTLDGNQHLVSGSVNHLYKPLWIGG